VKILFIDPVCPSPYDLGTLNTKPLGGTEGTVVRLVEGFNAKGITARVAQHNRTEASGHYVGFGQSAEYKPTHVIVLRAPMALAQARKQFPNAKLYFHAHDLFGGPGWAEGFQAIVDTQTIPVCVSRYHQTQMYDLMRSVGFSGQVPSRVIYNPIADNLRPLEGQEHDPDKLVFFSSPHKGIEQTLKVFEQFQNFDELKNVKLYIANPGYYADHKTELTNVILLGSLAHPDVIDHVRSALAVFHLNSVFPETFGIVHAESNAVGTPFLSSAQGATRELADHPGELIDCQDPKAVIERIIQWRKGRPKVRGNPNFRLTRIIGEWLDLFKVSK